MGFASSSSKGTDRNKSGPRIVGIEFDDHDAGVQLAPFEIGGEEPAGQPPQNRFPALLGAALIVAVGAVLFFLSAQSESPAQGDPPNLAQDVAPTSAPPPASSTTEAPTTTTPEAPSFDLDQLPDAPVEWIAGTSVAWVGEGDLNLRSLFTGEDVEFDATPRIQIPPLLDSVALLGAPNQSFAISTTDPGESGLISQSFQTVRLANGVSTFGFLQNRENGEAMFSTGTLWGPSIAPLYDVASDASIHVVQSRGFAIAYPDGTSELIVGASVDEAPSRLGRIVAASTDRLAGIHCDGVGVCIGRITTWEGDQEREVDAQLLAGPIVRLLDGSEAIFGWSRNGATMLSSLGDRAWVGGPPMNETVIWDAPSGLLFWVYDDALLVIDPFDQQPQAHVVRSVGPIELDANSGLLLLAL